MVVAAYEKKHPPKDATLKAESFWCTAKRESVYLALTTMVYCVYYICGPATGGKTVSALIELLDFGASSR